MKIQIWIGMTALLAGCTAENEFQNASTTGTAIGRISTPHVGVMEDSRIAAEAEPENGTEATTGHEGGDRGGMMLDGASVMPIAFSSVEDIPGGAWFVLRPQDPTQPAALREHARIHPRGAPD